jgi:hypothetical protein
MLRQLNINGHAFLISFILMDEHRDVNRVHKSCVTHDIAYFFDSLILFLSDWMSIIDGFLLNIGYGSFYWGLCICYIISLSIYVTIFRV